MYHFISGYTSKIGGTEKGLGKEPKATFSACFGAPFMVLHPYEYATLLAKKIEKHNAKIWLVNTGWTGGPYGVGERMKIQHSRAVLKAALSGELDSAEYQKDPVFGFEVPKECSGVPSEILDPKQTWDNPDDYDKKAKDLAERFIKNFKEYADEVPAEVEREGPNI
jgi:phosphoenolpyruvate carboxykinase (ATP)